mmetsp:Transcript_15349/g.30978  ORF Transcript_15349/g.30978 Transcript_15349/m.30978 type:complete len:400 (+) Transcript_15349:1658-2857(+)
MYCRLISLLSMYCNFRQHCPYMSSLAAPRSLEASSSQAASSPAPSPAQMTDSNSELDGYETCDADEDLHRVATGKVQKKSKKKRREPWIHLCDSQNVELLRNYHKDPSSAPPATKEGLEHVAEYVPIIESLRQEYPQDVVQERPSDELRQDAVKKHKNKFGDDVSKVIYDPNAPRNDAADKIQRERLPAFRRLDKYVQESELYGGQAAKTAGTTSSNPLESHNVMVLGNYPGHLQEDAIVAQGNVVLHQTEKGYFGEPYHRTGHSANRGVTIVQHAPDPLAITQEIVDGIDQNQATNETFWHDSHLVCLHNKSGGAPATKDKRFRGHSAQKIVEDLIVFGSARCQIIPNGKEATIFVIDVLVPVLAAHGMLHHLKVFSGLVAASAVDPRKVELRHLTVL